MQQPPEMQLTQLLIQLPQKLTPMMFFSSFIQGMEGGIQVQASIQRILLHHTLTRITMIIIRAFLAVQMRSKCECILVD